MVSPYTISSYIVFEYNDAYIKEKHKDIYFLPGLEATPHGPDKILISDKTEEEIRQMPELKIDVMDRNYYSEENIKVLIRQFKDAYNNTPKEYYEVEY